MKQSPAAGVLPRRSDEFTAGSNSLNVSVSRKLIFVAGREQLRSYGALVLLMILAAFLEALGIGVVLPFLGAIADPAMVMKNQFVAPWVAAFHLEGDHKMLVVVAGSFMIAAITLKNILVFCTTWQQGRLLFRERARIARKLFLHYLQLPYSLHLKKNMATLIHVAAGVSTNFTTVYMASLLMIVAETLVCFAIIGLLLAVNMKATVVAGLFILVVGGIYAALTRVSAMRLGHEQNRLVVAANKCLIEGLSALKETRVFGAAPHFLRRFDRLSDQYTQASVRMQVFSQAPKLMVETVFVIAVVASVIFLSMSGRDLKAIVPTLVLFGMAFLRMLPSYNRILVSLTNLRLNQSALDMLHQELCETLENENQNSLIEPVHAPMAFAHELRLENVSYRYPGEESLALRGVSMSIPKGQSIGLVGKSGAGKTTLVDIILGLLAPEEGTISVDGVSVAEATSMRGLVGYIPQSIYLTDDSLRRNIAFGIDDEDIDEQALMQAIDAAQLSGFIAGLADGLETLVGDKGVRLSGGQKQRVGIARALYRNPKILVLDEATSALDVETEAAVTEAIHALGRHKTMIIIAHRLSTVKDCDCLYLIDDGHVADHGTYAELNERNAWFRRISDILA